jgi:hypothetical protein
VCPEIHKDGESNCYRRKNSDRLDDLGGEEQMSEHIQWVNINQETEHCCDRGKNKVTHKNNPDSMTKQHARAK